MRIIFLTILVTCLCLPLLVSCETYEDNEFAEFEDFDADDEFVAAKPSDQPKKPESVKTDDDDKNSDFAGMDDSDDDEIVVEEEDSEFEHFQDEEEFEGFSGGATEAPAVPTEQKTGGEPKLTMAKVPLHFRTHWDSYWLELIMIAGLLAYFSNYFVGKSKNGRLANMWLETHKLLLEENFVLVGDDGKQEIEQQGLMKESDSLYTLWCSGRTCCEGMLVELRMMKRQDLISIVAGLMKPTQDQVHIKVELSKDAVDTFVFCVAAKKTATKFFKDLSDLVRKSNVFFRRSIQLFHLFFCIFQSKFCLLVNKPEEKYNVPIGFSVLSEIPEATSAVLDSKMVAALNKYGHLIDFIQISDQYCGPIQQEDPNQLKQSEVKRMLICGFNLPQNVDMETTKPLMNLVFYLMERLKRYRLSKEAKNKADKNRQRVEEQFLKNTHAARAEAAAQRREDKRKQEKDKVMADDDPEKQRRWEKKEQKRQLKKKTPKVKQLSIKAL